MAVVFNGTSSNIDMGGVTAFSIHTNPFSIVFWYHAYSKGELSVGNFFQVGSNVSSDMHLRYQAAATRFAYRQSVAGLADAVWTFSSNAAFTGTWNALCLTYDRVTTANDPACMIGFRSAPTNVTTRPTTAYQHLDGRLFLGHAGTSANTYDGRMAHFQLFNRILSTAEQNTVLLVPGLIQNGLKLWLPLYHLSAIGNHARQGPKTFSSTALSNNFGPARVRGLFPWVDYDPAIRTAAVDVAIRRVRSLLGIGL